MGLLRPFSVLVGVVLAATQSFGVASVHFATAVDYAAGANGANSVVAVDVNGDGFPDMIVATNQGVTVALNDGLGDGLFLSPTTYSTGGPLSNAVAVVDVNGDGYPDIIVTNMCTEAAPLCYGIAVLLNDSNAPGTFLSAVGYDSGGLETGGVAVGDVNGDGWPDLIVTSNCQLLTCAGGTLTELLNKGDGTFGNPTELSDTKGPVALGDVNGDGILDLVTGAGVMLGVGNGTFSPPNEDVVDGALMINLADVNGDGKLDIEAVVPTGVAVQLGNGDGTFQSALIFKTGGTNPLSLAVGDVNGDGKPDLAVVNECSQVVDGVCLRLGSVGVLTGNGNGTFNTAITFLPGGTETTSVAEADTTQDGKLDLLTSNACTDASNCEQGVIGVLLNNFLAGVSMKIVSSLNPILLGQSVTFTVTLKSVSSVPDGSVVVFTDGAITLGTATTVNGIATLTTSLTQVGRQTITASYGGDVYHNASYTYLRETVNPYPSTTTLTSNPNPSTYDQAVTLTATVSSAEVSGPTGTVTFTISTGRLGTVTLSGGVATLTTSSLPQGTLTIKAVYHGDSQSASSTGSTTQTVN